MKKTLCFRLAVLCFSAFIFCGCQTPLSEKPKNAPWTLSELENKAAGSDPIEPFNRAMFSVQHVIMEYPVDWIGRVYTSILPRPAIKCINNLCLNLEFPARFVSSLLKAEWRGAGHEFLRFLANSTLGIAGLFDVGLHWFGLHSTDSDFGQSFHTWGIDPGCTLVLPFLPRVNFRDAAGFIFDCAFDGKTYIPYSSVVMLNQAIVAQELYHNAVAGASDPYKSYRETMVLRRELQNRLWFYRLQDRKTELFMPLKDKKLQAPERKLPEKIQANWHDLRNFGDFSPVASTLQVVMWQPEARNDWWYMPLSIFNSAFVSSMKKISAVLPNEGEVTCGFWKAPENKEKDAKGKKKQTPPPKLVVLLPGVGGSYQGSSTLALAELLNRNNCAVLSFDCPFSNSFMTQTRTAKLPGNVAHDAEILRGVLKKVLAVLKEKELIDDKMPRLLAGYSFGGLYTLKMAELEKLSPQLNFRRYAALNPPVSLQHASFTADELARSGSSWSEKKSFDILSETAGRLITASALGRMPEQGRVMGLFHPGEEEARFVAGLYFRVVLRYILHDAHRAGVKTPLVTPYSWWRRNALYLEIDKVSFKEYAEKFVAPHYPGKTVAELYRNGDIRSFKGVPEHPDVRIIHTWDDPLLSHEERLWLDSSFGKRLTWFSRGGHLGNMHMKEVREKIVEALLK